MIFSDDSVEIASTEAFVEAVVKALVKVDSMKASKENFVEA